MRRHNGYTEDVGIDPINDIRPIFLWCTYFTRHILARDTVFALVGCPCPGPPTSAGSTCDPRTYAKSAFLAQQLSPVAGLDGHGRGGDTPFLESSNNEANLEIADNVGRTETEEDRAPPSFALFAKVRNRERSRGKNILVHAMPSVGHDMTRCAMNDDSY